MQERIREKGQKGSWEPWFVKGVTFLFKGFINKTKQNFAVLELWPQFCHYFFQIGKFTALVVRWVRFSLFARKTFHENKPLHIILL
jgi:hypothetical protein